MAQEIEAYPGVRQAAVVARSRPGRHDKELCGYITGDQGLDPADLKRFLAGRLPGYMIPAVIMVVPEISRTANGKTDTRQLPDPFGDVPGGAVAAKHLDEVSSAVAGIWARTLQVDAKLLDEQSDFRDLVGNSLLMLSMIEEVNRSVVEGGQEDFLAQLPTIIRQPTLRTVSDVARDSRTALRDAVSDGAGRS